MTCQSHHCHQGRQPCPTPFTCRLGRDCTTLNTGNSDGSDPHRRQPTRRRSLDEILANFFLTLACAGGLVATLAVLVGLLSAKLA